jgi:tetratricopeptide (TPR) repeat protein
MKGVFMSGHPWFRGVFVLVLTLGFTACQSKSPNGGPGRAEASPEDKEIANYTEAIRLDPNKANERGNLLYHLRGAAHDRKGENDKAIADFTEAIRRYEANKPPDMSVRLAEAHYSRGLSYKTKKDYDKAIADFTATIEPAPKTTDKIGDALVFGGFTAMALYERGLCFEAKGEDAKAKNDFEEAVKIAPGILSGDDERALDLKKRLKK